MLSDVHLLGGDHCHRRLVCGRMGVWPVERVGVRRLKDHLSEYLAHAREGRIIIVTDHGVPIAKLTPMQDDGDAPLYALASLLNNGWQGGKPVGIAASVKPRLTDSTSLSRAIEDDRDSR